MDHAVKIVKTEKRSALVRYLRRQRFSDHELEQIYQQYALKTRRQNVQMCLAIFSPFMLVLSVLHFVFNRGATVRAIYYAFQSCVFIFMLLVLSYNAKNRNVFLGVKIVTMISMVALGFFALPLDLPVAPTQDTYLISAAEDVFKLAFYSVAVCTLLPFDTYMSLFYGFFMGFAHTVSAALSTTYAGEFLWQQIGANLCVFVLASGLGLYIQWLSETLLRKGFLHMRNSVSARLDIQEEEDKLEKSLTSAFPTKIALEMKREIGLDPQRIISNQYIECYDDVSIIFADIVGFRALAAQCNAADLVRILNELFSKLDELAVENHCLRVRILGDRYFAVCGVSEPRDDHARCAVNFAIDLLETISSVGEATELPLSIRCGIHSGHVTCGVLGIRKWQYDVWSTDVDIASQLEISCQPGRIHISDTTAALLSDAYPLEDASGHARNTFLRDKAVNSFFLNTQRSLQKSDGSFPFATGSLGCRGSKRMSFRNVSLSVLRLLHSARFHSEVPFSTLAGSQDFKYSSLSTKLKGSPSSDKFKRTNGKKRSGTMFSPEATNRVNRHLSKTLSEPGSQKELSKRIHGISLVFRDTEEEQMFRDEPSIFWSKSYLFGLLCLLCFGAFHAFVLPHDLTPLILYVISGVWIAILFVLAMLRKTQGFTRSVLRLHPVSTFLCLASLVLFAGSGLANVFLCPSTLEAATEARECYSPQYIVVSCALTQWVVLAFVQVSALVQSFFALGIAVVYVLCITIYGSELFDQYGQVVGSNVPLTAEAILGITVSTLLVFVLSRWLEYLIRTSFLWKIQGSEDRCEVTELQRSNQKVLFNLLPVHVACHFLDNTFVNNLDLYSNSYNAAGVLFASLPNFNAFYDAARRDDNCRGCFRLLHDVICMLYYGSLLQDLYSNSYNAAGVLFASLPNFNAFYDAARRDDNCRGCFRLLHDVICMLYYGSLLQDLYSNSYNAAGVLFASLPNFNAFYDAARRDDNCRGCFRLLHDVICMLYYGSLLQDLYSNSYNAAGVLFASLPNFNAFYDAARRDDNCRGCFRLLHDVICMLYYGSLLQDLYSNSYNAAGVLFASLPNFNAFYDAARRDDNCRGCFRLLHDVICMLYYGSLLQDLYSNSYNAAGVLFASLPNFNAFYDAARRDDNCRGCFRLLHDVICMLYYGSLLQDLYSNSYNAAGVLFASLPNFNAFYDAARRDDNCRGCFRLLHDVICMFDELLFDDRFKCLEKVKTNGPGYVVAVGLIPELKIENGTPNFANSAVVLTDFAFAMKERLSDFNAKYRSRFILRIGIHSGPIVSGVISAKRPQYDIWGQTVNIACRLERSSLPNHIQVSEDVYLATRNEPFSFEFRGVIKIDDKAEIKTYVVTDKLPNNIQKSPRPIAQPRRIPLPGLAREPKEPCRPLRSPDEVVTPNDVILQIEEQIEDKLPWTGIPKQTVAKLINRSQISTNIQAIPEVTDVETDMEELPLLRSYLRCENRPSAFHSPARSSGNRKNSAPILPSRLSRPEDLSLSCSFNENLNNMREHVDPKDQRSPQVEPKWGPTKWTPASMEDSVTAVISSPPNADLCENHDRSKDPCAFDYSDMSDANNAVPSPGMDSFTAGVKKRFKRKNKKGNGAYNWKRASTTSSEFEFVEPSPQQGRTPEKWQIRSFFRARTVSSSSAAADKKATPPVKERLDSAVHSKDSPFSPLSINSNDLSASASEFELDQSERENLIRMHKDAITSPLDRTGYLAAVYGIPRDIEVNDRQFIRTNVPVSKPLGIVYPLPSPACSGYGSDKHSQSSPRTTDLLSKLAAEAGIANGRLLSPFAAKPFPTDAITQFVDSPDQAYTTATTNLSSSNAASQGATPGSDTRQPASLRKIFSETDYDNAESDYLLYSESEKGRFSPESRMLRQPRLLVPGYNLSVIQGDPDPVLPPRLTRDDSYLDMMFGHGSLRRRALGSLQSLDYLGIDTGNEADVDSLASSRCSSRLFSDPAGPGYQWQPGPAYRQPDPFMGGAYSSTDILYRRPFRLSVDYESEYDNFRPGMISDEEFTSQRVSDMELDFFDHDSLANLRRVTADIQKSFGNVQLSTYSDGE